MREQTGKARASKAKLARALLLAGSLVLTGEAWLFLLRIEQFWKVSGAATLGWMAAVGALAQKALSLLLSNEGLLLAGIGKVLVLCSPLVLVFAGMVIMRSMTSADEGASMNGAPVNEEDR